MSRTITWLHLSDLHARQRDGWDSRQITDALVRDLKAMHKEHGLRPDFIFFTGDIAFGAVSGETLADQYRLVRGFLDGVRKAFEPEIPTRDVYLVPGNHDVDRNEITPEQTAWLRHPDRRLDEILAAMRDGKKQWRSWLERLDAYKNFLTAYGLMHLKPDDRHLIWEDQREIHGIRVGIAGLNSAWSCADDEDKGRLWLGAEWQIAELKRRMGPVDFAFALLHHPGSWLNGCEDPAAMRRLRQEFQVVLHGHEHQEWVEFDGDRHLMLSAGACYESSWMENGYSFGQLDLNRQSGTVWLRQWDKQGRGWVARNIHGKTDNGIWPLPNLSWLKLAPPGMDEVEAEPALHADDSPVEPGESVEAYYTRKFCRYVIEQHDVLELFGCDIPRELQRHQLSVAYVSLNLATEDEEDADSSEPNLLESFAQSGQDPLDFELGRKPGQRFRLTNAAIEVILDQVAADGGRLLIYGPAGAGKSTLLRWCAIHAAQHVSGELPGAAEAKAIVHRAGLRAGWEEPSEVSGGWRRKVPFLIRLRDCPNGCLPPAVEWPRFLAKHLPTAPADWITGLLERGEGLVLFDGVDEIHRDKRAQLADEIRELVRAYPRSVYVISTRPGAVEDGWLERLNFIEARVEPMNRRDREEFIDKWYHSAALELQRRPRPGEDLARTAAGLKAELADQPELALLATNPLLCAMICALYRERQERLPETPAELCEALCQMLLHRRERESVGLSDEHFATSWRALTYPQKKDLLADLAWAMVSRGESSMEQAEAGTLVVDGLARTPGRKPDEAEEVL